MITIKEEFLRDSKLLLAIKLGGHESVTMWLLLKAYAATNPTDGFVPDEEIETLSAGLLRRPRKALDALVNCGKLKGSDGIRGAGLVDKVPLGWQLHDYLDHAYSSDELAVRKQKDRERKQLQRHRITIQKKLTESGMSADEAERQVRKMTRDELRKSAQVSRDMSHAPERDMSRDTSADVPCARPRVRSRAGACDPQPSPAQPSPAMKDHDPLVVLLPPDWDPGPDVHMGSGIPPWAHKMLLQRYRSYHCNGEAKRTDRDWRQAFARWAANEWQSDKRPQRPADESREASRWSD